MADQVRGGSYPIVGGGQGVWSFVHVEDAANGIVLALDGMPGVYNITNDTPVTVSTWLPAYAKGLGAPPPPTRSIEEEMRINGPDLSITQQRCVGLQMGRLRGYWGFGREILCGSDICFA